MSFEHLPDSSRVWIFFCNRPLTINEAAELGEELKAFVSGWKAHGSALTAGYELQRGVALAIAVDESVAQPTGCSIDKAFRLLQEFGADRNVDFFNRMLLVTAGGIPEILSKADAAKRFEEGRIVESTLVYNGMADNLKAYRNSFIIPFSEHWLRKQLAAVKSA